MTPATLNDPVRAFLRSIAPLNPTERRDAFVNAILEGGGRYDAPAIADHPSCLFEVSLHDIRATGTDEISAITNWIDAANRTIAEPSDTARADHDARSLSPHSADRLEP